MIKILKPGTRVEFIIPGKSDLKVESYIDSVIINKFGEIYKCAYFDAGLNLKYIKLHRDELEETKPFTDNNENVSWGNMINNLRSGLKPISHSLVRGPGGTKFDYNGKVCKEQSDKAHPKGWWYRDENDTLVFHLPKPVKEAKDINSDNIE